MLPRPMRMGIGMGIKSGNIVLILSRGYNMNEGLGSQLSLMLSEICGGTILNHKCQVRQLLVEMKAVQVLNTDFHERHPALP